jgi:transposase InsO family protein
MCQVLNVSTSGYYAWYRRPESSQSQSNRVLDSQIQQIYTEHKQRYGVPRITHELKDQGFHYSENRVARTADADARIKRGSGEEIQTNHRFQS